MRIQGRVFSHASAKAAGGRRRVMQWLAATLVLLHSLALAAEDDGTRLMAAAREGDLTAMQTALQRGADPNARDAHGATALMFAAGRRGAVSSQAAEAVRLLLAHDATVNARAADGSTALILAAAAGNDAGAALLLDAGADPDAQTALGDSALLEATAHGDAGLAMTLLQAGARVDPVDANGETPLLMAIRQAPQRSAKRAPYEPIALALLQGGADPNHSDRNGQTPLSVAAAGDKTVLAYPLLQYRADPNVVDPTAGGASPLIIAVKHRNVPLVKLLLRNGAKVGTRDRFGKNALHYAKARDDREMQALLVRSAASAR